MSSLIAQCRIRSENIKQKFRTQDESKKMAKKKLKASKSGKTLHNSQAQDAVNAEPLVCVCCEKEVSLPCFVCATCDADNAICIDCETNQAKVVKYEDRSSMHSHHHLLLRINDSQEVQSREVNNVRLQKELINITADLRSLEEKVVTHLRAASKVNVVLRRLTSDPEAKPAIEVDVTPTAETGEMPNKPVMEDDEEDDSDYFGSIYSSDTESVSISPRSPPPPQPEDLLEPTTGGLAGEIAELQSESQSYLETAQSDGAQRILPSTEGPLMDTPLPSSDQFFQSFAVDPTSFMPGNEETNTPLPPPQSGQTKSQRLNSHLMSIDARISSLDERMTGLESQLNQVLELLMQTRS